MSFWLKKPMRLQAAKDISVADLQSCLEQFLGEQSSRGLTAVLAELKQNVTWKNAAKPSVLSKFAPLFSRLAAASRTGVSPSKKLAVALASCHREKPCNFTGQELEHWSDDMSCLLRAAFSKYRDLARDQELYRRAISKATLAVFVVPTHTHTHTRAQKTPSASAAYYSPRKARRVETQVKKTERYKNPNSY